MEDGRLTADGLRVVGGPGVLSSLQRFGAEGWIVMETDCRLCDDRITGR